eukprot:ANDGO_05571.mRNA.1 hypothetical protein
MSNPETSAPHPIVTSAVDFVHRAETAAAAHASGRTPASVLLKIPVAKSTSIRQVSSSIKKQAWGRRFEKHRITHSNIEEIPLFLYADPGAEQYDFEDPTLKDSVDPSPAVCVSPPQWPSSDKDVYGKRRGMCGRIERRQTLCSAHASTSMNMRLSRRPSGRRGSQSSIASSTEPAQISNSVSYSSVVTDHCSPNGKPTPVAAHSAGRDVHELPSSAAAPEPVSSLLDKVKMPHNFMSLSHVYQMFDKFGGVVSKKSVLSNPAEDPISGSTVVKTPFHLICINKTCFPVRIVMVLEACKRQELRYEEYVVFPKRHTDPQYQKIEILPGNRIISVNVVQGWQKVVLSGSAHDLVSFNADLVMSIRQCPKVAAPTPASANEAPHQPTYVLDHRLHGQFEVKIGISSSKPPVIVACGQSRATRQLLINQ